MEEYKYKAFISYSHKDIEFAEKLQKKLEDFKLPYAEKNNAKKFKIFRDVTDLTTGALQENLNDELENSEYLIVICSPNSAKTSSNKHWVNEEVKYFKELGRENKIIPVVIQGVPNSQDEDENCYCPELRFNSKGDEFLGVDAIFENTPSSIELLLRKIGIPSESDKEERAFVHIIAKLLNLKFDSIWNREKRNKLKKLSIIGGLSFLFVFLFVFLLIDSNIVFIVENFILCILLAVYSINRFRQYKIEMNKRKASISESYVILQDNLRLILEKLNPDERKIISSRFGLEDGYSLTLDECCLCFGVTVNQIREIERKALDLMKGEK